MATTRCECGEHIHYSAENVGFNARCRCGRMVTLPKIAVEPAPRTPQQLFEDDRRSTRIRRQVLAVGLVLIATIGLVLLVALLSQSSTSARPRTRPAEELTP